eukprot:Em0020g959a
MGGGSSRQAFRQAVLDLISTKEAVAGQGNTFWERYWSDPVLTAQDYFALVTTEDVQNLKKDASGNLTALCFKVVERINVATTTACTGPNDHVADPRGRAATSPGTGLAQLSADLLFCPDFTVVPKTKQGPENPDDLSSIDSCEHIWEAGIGCSVSPGRTAAIDSHRTEIIKLLVTCFSETLYYKPEEIGAPNRWMLHFTSSENRHVLPILTSLLNVTCTYDPVGYGVPYYWTMVGDPRGDLVEAAVQLLCLVLDYYPHSQVNRLQAASQAQQAQPEPGAGNLFCGYVSRLHQNEDLEFIAKGMINLIYNPVRHTYLPYSIKKVFFTQELYIVLWKMCELNKRFMIHLLRSPVLFDLVVPILINILESRANPGVSKGDYQWAATTTAPGTPPDLLTSGSKEYASGSHLAHESGILRLIAFWCSLPLALKLALKTHTNLVANKPRPADTLQLMKTRKVIIKLKVKTSLQTQMVKRSRMEAHLNPGRVQMVEVEVGEQSTEQVGSKTTPSRRLPRLSLPNFLPQATPVAAMDSPASQRGGLTVGAHTYASAYDARSRQKGKGKPLSPTARTDASHRDFARSTQSLVEPLATPDSSHSRVCVVEAKKLPLHTIIRCFKFLFHKFENLCAENDVKTDQEILEYLKNGTLVGLLPVPHPILIRKYQTSENTEKWFHTATSGVFSTSNYDPPIWYDTSIRLFQVAKSTVG